MAQRHMEMLDRHQFDYFKWLFDGKRCEGTAHSHHFTSHRDNSSSETIGWIADNLQRLNYAGITTI